MTRRKPTRSFGYVTRLGSGRFRASWSQGTGKPRASAPHTFDTEVEARAYLLQVQADRARGVVVNPSAGRETLNAFAARFLADHNTTKAAATAYGYEVVWRKHIGPSLGRERLQDIKPSHVRSWIAKQVARGDAANSIRQRYRLLSLVLGAAVDDDLIAKSPLTSAVRKALPRPPTPEPTIWEADDLDRFRMAIPAEHVLVFDVLRHTGLRIGEALALRRRDVDQLRRTLHVRGSVTEAGTVAVKAPKSGKSRQVSLPAPLLDALMEHLDANVPAAADSLLWANRHGRPLTYKQITARVFAPAREVTGLFVKPHALRATHGSEVAAKFGPLVAAARLGHGLGVSLMAYQRPLAGQDEQVADWLGEAAAR